MSEVRYRWTLLRAGRFKLDGGSMFGLVPRAVWSRAVQPDERGRIPVQHNCLLLERAAGALTSPGLEGSSTPSTSKDPRLSSPSGTGKTGSPERDLPAPKLILIEAGTGNKLDPKSRDIFELEDRSILDALYEVDRRPEDIGGVVTTHLHFDHSGGLTRLARPGETPDWTGPASCFSGSRGEHGVKRSFPNAVIFAQAREWSDALANRSVMTRTYFPDHLLPIKDQVRLVDSPRPWPVGYTPDRDEFPRGSVEVRRTEVMPGVFVFLVPGHTWGQQAIQFTDDQGRTVVFTPDVMPTVNHLGAAYSLGYDVEPYTSMMSRQWFLDAASSENWLLVLDHEPGNPCQRVRRNDRNWFDLVPDGP